MKTKKTTKPPSKGDKGSLKFLQPGRTDPHKLEGAPLEAVSVKKKSVNVRLLKTCGTFRKGTVFQISHTEFKRAE